MNIVCPLCKFEHYKVIYKNVTSYPHADIVKCTFCNHFYTYLPEEVDLDNLYSDEVYKVVENRNSIFDKVLSLEYNRVVKKIKSLNPRYGLLLDFGCGKGKFGSLASKAGWKVKCVETSTERARYASSVYGLDVNADFYQSGKIFDTEFEALTLFHVLEHLPAPEELLRELIKYNLKEKALVVVEVPNFKSFQSNLAKNKWLHLDAPRHVSHFTPERLHNFLKQLDLIVIKKSSFSWHLGVLGMLDSLMKLFGFKKNIIYELKNKRNFLLLLKISILLPFAILFETLASLVNRGGIIRFYLLRKHQA
jgi:2-polyprenyl-3-methyl-5-hydroxy-6-metoxy-1,4-benzoquinol methylase